MTLADAGFLFGVGLAAGLATGFLAWATVEVFYELPTD